jgi:hypothetical protein
MHQIYLVNLGEAYTALVLGACYRVSLGPAEENIFYVVSVDKDGVDVSWQIRIFRHNLRLRFGWGKKTPTQFLRKFTAAEEDGIFKIRSVVYQRLPEAEFTPFLIDGQHYHRTTRIFDPYYKIL